MTKKTEDSRSLSTVKVSRVRVVNKFVVCLKSSKVVLFIGPLVVLFLFEAALILAFVRQCREEGLFPRRPVSRRRKEAPGFAVSQV